MNYRRISLAALFTFLFTISSTPVNFLRLFQTSQVLAQTASSQKEEAKKLLQQGAAQFSNGQIANARESLQKALTIYREIKERQDESVALFFLGVTYNKQKEYITAIDYYQQALQIVQQLPNHANEGVILIGLGDAYRLRNDYTQAIQYYQQYLALDQQLQDSKDRIATLGNLGESYIRLKDLPRGVEYYQQALILARATNDRDNEVVSLVKLGEVYLDLENYAAVIDVSRQGLALAREKLDSSALIRFLQQISNAYYYIADYDQAIEYSQQSLAIARTVKDLGDQSQALNSLGNIYYQKSEYNKAIDYYQQVLAIHRSQKDRRGEGLALGNIGLAYVSKGEAAKAIEYHEKDLAIEREFRDRLKESQTLGYLGTAYSQLKNYSKAIEYYQQSLAIAREVKYTRGEGITLYNLANDLIELGKLPEAEKNLFTAIEVFESLREKLGKNDAYKVSIFEDQAHTYRLLEEVLINQKKYDEALVISERGRARAFVDLLASRLSANAKGGSTQQLEPKVDKPTLPLLQQIAKQQNATLVEYSIDSITFSGKEEVDKALNIWVIKPTGEVTFRRGNILPIFEQKKINIGQIVDQTRQSIVKGVNLASRGNNITLTPGDRVKLNQDQPDWEAWQVVSVDIKNSKITIRLPSWEAKIPAIEIPIADVAKKIGINSSGANAKNLQLQELYQLLIEPIADILPKEETARVIFIPQDALFLVPFPALQDSSGQYLIDKHTILTAPSIQVLESTHKLRQKVPGSAKDILIVGNPTMPKVLKKPRELPQQLGALPGSEKEALAIASFWKTQALIGNQATKKAVLQKLPLAKIIHLATHGLLDNIRGLGSSIVFAPEGEDNGLLTAEDILNLYAQPQGSALSAELVVLSACDTGQGRLTGDGVIGLSRSIIAAGVPSVIVSLWSIPDAPTAELMTEFYENFRKNPDKATALRQAMLMTKKKHPNPSEWAAFTLIGESE